MEIAASKCLSCENVIIPPRNICPYCGPESHEIIEIKVDPSGEVISFTSLERPPEGFEPPVILALVRTLSGATILCLGTEKDILDTRIGSLVGIDRDSQGRFIYRLEK